MVFNPLTGETRALPPLFHPRNPVLVHISVDSAEKSYKVVVAGSSFTSDEHLSRKVEVFDSSTSKWKEVCDLPGPAFGLNEHQAGVCLNGILFFISFLQGGGRGVVAFDLEEEKWLEILACRIPSFVYLNTLQLVENDARTLFLFYVQERGATIEHCIHQLEFRDLHAGELDFCWRIVVRVRKFELPMYPELLMAFTCVGYGEGKLLIFNTLSRDGVVYDGRDGRQFQVLEPPPPDQKGEKLFSTLNAASFSLQPNFAIDPSFSMAAL